MKCDPPQPLVERLRGYRQERLLRWWDELETDQQNSLVAQIEVVDFDLIQCLVADNHNSATAVDSPAERAQRATPPSTIVRLPSSSQDEQDWANSARQGREILAAGKVGAILVAGGQGTRLGFPHPKGMFPIGPVSNNSLFQILTEQLIARSRHAGVSIPYYIMTSDATHDETVAFFTRHNNFGLDSHDIHFFKQGTMPAVDAQTGQLLLAEKGLISTSPDGHGGMLAALQQAGLIEEMRNRGIEYLYYHQVDNPTARVCDPAFIGFHALHNSEMSTKVVAKRSAEEKMGVVVDVDGKMQIIEYSDLPVELAQQTDEAGNLKIWAGNMAIHIFNHDFLERLLASTTSLPIHLARKTVPYLDDSGRLVAPAEPNAWKFERFIFDALPFARSALVVEADRAREFNPVKNKDGFDSPETSKNAMTQIFRSWLRETGTTIADDVPVEISPLFALDADELRQKVQLGTVDTKALYLS